MTDYVELCCICDVQHEGAQLTEISDGLYCEPCEKDCTCVVCGQFQLVPCSNHVAPCGNHVAIMPFSKKLGAESINDHGPICLDCADKIGVDK